MAKAFEERAFVRALRLVTCSEAAGACDSPLLGELSAVLAAID